MFQKIKLIPLYPFFFIAYPVVALLGFNINEVEPSVLWRPLIVLLFSAIILLAVLWLLLRDLNRAAVLLFILIL